MKSDNDWIFWKKLRSIIQIPQSVQDELASKDPPANNEFSYGMKSNDESPEKVKQDFEKRKKKVMEENLCKMMKSELDEWEKEWVTYEKEKAQVTFDWADRIMEAITEETAKILADLEKKRVWF